MQVSKFQSHLSWYLISSHWMLIGLLSVPKEVSEVDERQGDAEPHRTHTEHGCERNRATRVFPPDEEVDEDPDPQHYPRVQSRGQKRSSL